MNPWRDSVRFAQPLRAVLCTGTRSAAAIAEEEAHDREQAAFERGQREGEQALGAQLLRQRSELSELQQGVLNSLSAAVPRVVQETEKVLVELALETARKLVADMPISAEMVQAVIHQAISEVEQETEFEVSLNPQDLALLQKSAPGSDGAQALPQNIRLTSSPDVGPGGCIVYTRFGMIDARRETKIEILRDALKL